MKKTTISTQHKMNNITQPDPAKLEEEYREYIKANGIHAAKSDAVKWWKSVFEAGGRGTVPPTMAESGLPYLVLERNKPSAVQAKKSFDRGFKLMTPEESHDRAMAAKRREQAKQDAAESQEERVKRAVTDEDKLIANLISPEQEASLTAEMRAKLLAKADSMKKRVIRL